MLNSLLIDSNFLIALHNPFDKNHVAALTFSAQDKTPRLIPEVVLVETAYMLRQTIGQKAVLVFLDTLVIARSPLISVTLKDLQRGREILAQYVDADFDLADACIMALSERLEITNVCTFDRHDFEIFRPKHCDYLEIVP